MTAVAPREVVASHRPSPLRKWLRARVLERTLRRLPRTSDVLDLCCGYGFYFDINPAAAGFDGDPRCVEALRARGLAVTLGNVLERLPYDDGRILRPGGRFLVIVPNRKGFDYGLEIGVGHRLFVTAAEIAALTRGRFEVEASYPEPLPRWLGRFFTHNKEVFRLRKA